MSRKQRFTTQSLPIEQPTQEQDLDLDLLIDHQGDPPVLDEPTIDPVSKKGRRKLTEEGKQKMLLNLEKAREKRKANVQAKKKLKQEEEERLALEKEKRRKPKTQPKQEHHETQEDDHEDRLANSILEKISKRGMGNNESDLAEKILKQIDSRLEKLNLAPTSHSGAPKSQPSSSSQPSAPKSDFQIKSQPKARENRDQKIINFF